MTAQIIFLYMAIRLQQFFMRLAERTQTIKTRNRDPVFIRTFFARVARDDLPDKFFASRQIRRVNPLSPAPTIIAVALPLGSRVMPCCGASSAFFVNGAGGNFLRLSFSQPPPTRIEEGVRRLAAVIHEEIERLDQGVGAGGGGASKGTERPRT